MTCPDEQIYRHTLQHLHKVGVQFCVMGTFGLYLYNPDYLAYPVKDCDLIVYNSPENLNLLAQHLNHLQWQLHVWNVPVAYPLPLPELTGKYYLRAVRQTALLDATYECEAISWQAFWQEHQLVKGIPLASVRHILRLKEMRNTEADQQVIIRVQAMMKQKGNMLGNSMEKG